jgi:hypothetical protein
MLATTRLKVTTHKTLTWLRETITSTCKSTLNIPTKLPLTRGSTRRGRGLFELVLFVVRQDHPAPLGHPSLKRRGVALRQAKYCSILFNVARTRLKARIGK